MNQMMIWAVMGVMDMIWWQSAGASMVLIALAEIGDKSQLVCMVLAARHGRARPVLLGAIIAFGILNSAAVMVGASLTIWLPQVWVLGAMAGLFAFFGVHSLMQGEGEQDHIKSDLTGHGLFVTTFLMIFLAEMGDKTQIAVAGLAGVYPAMAVWVGATVALILTSALGVLAGKTVLRRLPMVWLHRLAGMLFLSMSALAIWRLMGVL